MQDILKEIIAHKRIEVEQEKTQILPQHLYRRVEQHILESHQPPRSMSKALANSHSGVIAEFKRKSPSKSWIKETGRADIIPLAYEKAGATALSILTDMKYFGGSIEFIQTARAMVNVPILRKEFIIDEYQLFQAKLIGADAVLLIASCLTQPECTRLTELAHNLELEVLLEIHNEKELDYLISQPNMVGINNRDLTSFETDVNHSFQLATQLPHDVLWISESGISQPSTIRALRQAGFKGFLIGEAFMKEEDPGKALHTFIQSIEA